MKKLQNYRDIVKHDKKVICMCMDSIQEMKVICQEYAIKDKDLMMKIGNIENKVKNTVKFERKEFNIGKINESNDFFVQEETDETELPLSLHKVFLLEQNLKTLIQKLNSAQANSGKGLNFIIELGIL